MTTVNHHGTSDQGRVRFNNEDFIISRCPEEQDVLAKKGSFFVIADGLGGHDAGEVASSAAGTELVKSYYGSKSKPERALRAAFSHTNLHVFDLGITTNHLNMQTTLSAIAIVGSRLYVGHVGDSRIYRVRGLGRIELLTQDHSEVGELVRMNILSPDRVRKHSRRNVVTKSVGSQPVVQAMFKSDTVLEGDIFVLCTDGVWEPVEDAEIAEIVATYPPNEACQKLISAALERQSNDNLSVQVIRVLTVSEDTAPTTAGGSHWWHKLWSILRGHAPIAASSYHTVNGVADRTEPPSGLRK